MLSYLVFIYTLYDGLGLDLHQYLTLSGKQEFESLSKKWPAINGGFILLLPPPFLSVNEALFYLLLLFISNRIIPIIIINTTFFSLFYWYYLNRWRSKKAVRSGKRYNYVIIFSNHWFNLVLLRQIMGVNVKICMSWWRTMWFRKGGVHFIIYFASFTVELFKSISPKNINRRDINIE